MNSDNGRTPFPPGPPNGDSAAARSGSTWIHWWSSVASANVFTRSWVTSNHSLTPSTCPFSEGTSASVVVVLLIAILLGPALRLAQTVPGRCVPAYQLAAPASRWRRCGQAPGCPGGPGSGVSPVSRGNTVRIGVSGDARPDRDEDL